MCINDRHTRLGRTDQGELIRWKEGVYLEVVRRARMKGCARQHTMKGRRPLMVRVPGSSGAWVNWVPADVEVDVVCPRCLAERN